MVPADQAPTPHPGTGGLGVAALISWLLTEGLGAYMFRSWLVSGGWRHRGSPDAAEQQDASGALIIGHASLAFCGFLSWVIFLATGTPAASWLAIGFLAPAIGLGISTVTVWTPYPARRPARRARSPASPAPGNWPRDTPAILVTNEMLDRVLASESLTGELVDDLVDKLLAEPGQPPQVSRGWQLAPVVPILHGLLAIATFLLATLAAINAVS
jgi:hypothetical protein